MNSGFVVTSRTVAWLWVCALAIAAAGCGAAEDPELAALRRRGAHYTLNEKNEVTGLYLYGTEEHPFGDADLEFLKNHPDLKLLLIESKSVTDAGLKQLRPLKKLEELDLTFCDGEIDSNGKANGGITDAGLATLKELPELERVSLQQTRVTDAAADKLQREQPELKVIFNYRDPILAVMRGAGTDFVPAVQQLGAVVGFNDEKEPIDLKLGVSDLALYYIGRVKTLESLTLRGNFSGEMLEQLAPLTNLRTLDIADPSRRRTIDANTMKTLVSFPNLKSLDLSGNQFSKTELQMLEQVQTLETLKIILCPVDKADVQQLKQSLPECRITFEGDPLLTELLNNGGDLAAALGEVAKRVERNAEGKIIGLEFRLSPIGDAGLAELAGLGELEWLHFHYCRRISDDGLQRFKELPKLRSLTLSHVNISNRGVSRIASLSGLEHLDLSTNRVRFNSTTPPIDDGGMRDLAALKELKSLSLRGTEIEDTGLRRLESLTALESLDIRDTRVTEEGLRRLKQKLPECKVEF